MLIFLKATFADKKIFKKLYFSDGAESQYKKRFDLKNVLFYEKDFGIEAEYNFLQQPKEKVPATV